MCWISVQQHFIEDGVICDVWGFDVLSGEGRRVCDAMLKDGQMWMVMRGKPVVELIGFEVTHWRYPPAPPGNSAHKTVSGRDARIVCDDRKGFGGKFPVLALVADDGGNEIAIPYGKDLKCEKSQHFPGEDLSIPPAP